MAPVKDLSYEQLTGIWNNCVHTDPGPAPDARDDLVAWEREQLYQTEMFWDPHWEEKYSVWGSKIGAQVPRGLMIGSWQIVKYNARGEVDCRWRNAKTIVTGGKDNLAAYLALANGSHSSTLDAYMHFLGTGTSVTSPSASDTAMGVDGSTNTEKPSAATNTRLAGTASSSTNTYQQQGTTATSVYSGNPTLAEAGMFNSGTAQTSNGALQGTMFDRSLLSPTAVMGSSDTLQLTFQITFS